MTEPTRPLPDAPAEATDSAPAAVNITRLVAEAMSKSGILWIRLPGGDTHPAWFVWHDDGDERGTGPAAYVISGIGEQPLPWLPAEVEATTSDAVAPQPAPGTAQPRRHHGGRRHALAAGLHDPRPHPPRATHRATRSVCRGARFPSDRPREGRDGALAPLALARAAAVPARHPVRSHASLA